MCVKERVKEGGETRRAMSQETQGAQTLRRSASFTLALASSASGGATALQPTPAAAQAFQQQLRVYQETVWCHHPSFHSTALSPATSLS